MSIKFFATRELARTVAREEGETFQDMGKDAPKGERWAVVFKELADLVAEAATLKEDPELNNELKAAFAAAETRKQTVAAIEKDIAARKPATVSRRERSVLYTREGQAVNVFTKRAIPTA